MHASVAVTPDTSSSPAGALALHAAHTPTMHASSVMNPGAPAASVDVAAPAGDLSHVAPSVHTPAADWSALLHSRTRWLKPNELGSLFSALSSCEFTLPRPLLAGGPLALLSVTPPIRPRPGAIYAFSKQRLNRWRKDQYTWMGDDRHHKYGGMRQRHRDSSVRDSRARRDRARRCILRVLTERHLLLRMSS
jgi:hypothetical protein